MTKKQDKKLGELQVRAREEYGDSSYINLHKKYNIDTLLCGGSDEYFIKSVNLDEKTVCLASKYSKEETLEDFPIAALSSDNIETIIEWTEFYIEEDEDSTAKCLDRIAWGNGSALKS